MKAIDYFFYVTYLFLTNRLNRTEDEAKWSALIHTTLYYTFLIDTVIYCIGLIKKYSVIEYYSSLNSLGLLIIASFIFVLLYVRYYKGKTFYNINEEYNEINDKKKIIIKRLIVLFMIIVPILLFIIKRFYLYGHV
ncbi:conserved membrane hypothetical protein [uncultured Paludibacter sp.]|nr:conserved membrane hypothetical protein [uncultured Paludibacter sp.]